MTSLVIFTEGGSRCGFGHVTRCSALYDEALARGLTPRFLVNGDQEVHQVLGNRRFEIIDWRTAECIRTNLSPDAFAIVDSYMADLVVYEAISSICQRAVFIDDNKRLSYPAGVVVNPSIYGHMLEYPKSEGVQYLLGPKYVILRPEFRNLPPREARKDARRILVTLGGADIRNLTPTLLQMLNLHFPELEKHVVIGPGFTNRAEIALVANERVVLHHQPSALLMRDLMLFCDLAVSAAGQTIYELLVTGLSFVAIEVIDNQANNVRGLLAMEAFRELVFKHDALEETRLIGALRTLSLPSGASEVPAIVDDKGTGRIISAL